MKKEALPNFQEGYIALITVVLMSSIVSVLVASQGVLIWNSHKGIEHAAAKDQSLLLAQGCARGLAAVLKAGSIPQGQVRIPVHTKYCIAEVAAIVPLGWKIKSHASVRGSESTLLAFVDDIHFEVVIESEPP